MRNIVLIRINGPPIRLRVSDRALMARKIKSGNVVYKFFVDGKEAPLFAGLLDSFHGIIEKIEQKTEEEHGLFGRKKQVIVNSVYLISPDRIKQILSKSIDINRIESQYTFIINELTVSYENRIKFLINMFNNALSELLKQIDNLISGRIKDRSKFMHKIGSILDTITSELLKAQEYEMVSNIRRSYAEEFEEAQEEQAVEETGIPTGVLEESTEREAKGKTEKEISDVEELLGDIYESEEE